MRVATLFAAVVLLAGGGTVSPAGAQNATDSDGLPRGEGRETVEAVCSGCHSMRLVEQQHMSRKRWDKTLDWMVAQQGMPELDPETRKTVLDYLATHFGTDRRDGERGFSPFNRVQPLQAPKP